MRNALLLLLVAALLPLSASAQDVQSSWEFDMIFPNDSTHLVHQHFGVQGLEVDNNNRVWVQSHYSRAIEESETDYAHIRVFEESGEEAGFSPVWEVTINDSTYRWASGTGRGMRLDHEGNILASFGSNVFRINAETGEGIAVFTPAHGASLTSVGVTSDGFIFAPAVGNDMVAPVHDGESFDFITNVDEERPGIARSATISADGTVAYVPLIGESGGRILTYRSEFGVYGTYTLDDPIVVGVHGETIAISRYDDILWVSSGNTSDGINVDAGEPTETNWEYGFWYGFDQETGELVDWIRWENQENDPVRPRGTAFSPDGQYAYLANFEVQGAGVQRFRRIETSIEQDNDIIPQSFELDQNYPNPFNPTTSIQFTVREAGQVSLRVYDMLGREVATLQEGALAPGQYTATFDANHLASGTYLYVLEAGGQRMTRSMVLLK